MPRGILTKGEIYCRTQKLMHRLHSGEYKDKGVEWNKGAHAALSSVLNIIEEYYQ